ncbi:zinc c6 transcription factor [Ophiostoma piceae UAMH 11346]|uniref:Zinc c6 transcription factor n=1 Tax=Ophiostoma piceae (strain UAMH 11346) TaxID=1262450 RepID=S3BV15_OPHP1|nr:zinc c6 transcription factor [Ophiostoma piceae UAMH 11346]
MSSIPSYKSSHGGAGSLPSPPSSQPRTQSTSQPQPHLQPPSQTSHAPQPSQQPLPSPGGDLHRKQSQSQLQSAQDKKQHRKRDRIRYSCTTCREKKLKCNRNSPCDQCEKRAIGVSCHFVPYQNPRQDRRAKSKNKKPSFSKDNDDSSSPQPTAPTASTAPNILPPVLTATIETTAPTSDPSTHHKAFRNASQPSSGTQAGPHRQGSVARDARQPGSAAHGEPAPYTHPAHQAGPHQQQGPNPRRVSRPRSPTRAPGASTLPPVEKLRFLESMVAALRQQISESSSPEGDGASGLDSMGEGEDEDEDDEDDSPPTPLTDPTPPENETHGNIVEGSRYIGSDNWEGVMGDVVKLTENLDFGGSEDESDESEDDHWDFGPKTTGLALLSGNFARVSVSDLFRFLPPRPTMDIMIDRFFNGKEPAWIMFHRPTFYKHYEAFWNDPRSASYTYLALLYMMLAQSAIFYLGAGEPIPGGLGEAIEVIDGCRTHAAHCLAVDDYTKPDKFKVETMLLYFRTEYLRQVDAPLGTAMILSITVRLALHMGYHRDPKHFPHLSAFEGEMRRRTWAVLTEVDKLVSFEFSLPANIKAIDYDTEVPRNLHDSDLNEDMEELPPSRPESEFTPVLYTICKGRMMWVFGDIMVTRMNSDALSLSRGYYEKDIMDLDKRLQAARESFGAPLKYIGAPAQVGDDGNAMLLTETPVEIVMQRCTLELLYQKVRLVLHRRFLGIARTHARFEYSRAVCIDAATRILRHQYDLYVSLLPGGPLSKDKWIRNSTHTHDFLLAGMVMCLEVSYARKESAEGKKSTRLPSSPTPPPLSLSESSEITEEKMLELLATSCSIWQMQREASAEANRAYKILTQLLWGSTGGIRGTPRETDREKEARCMAALACFAPDPKPTAMLSPEQHMMPMPVSRPINLTTAVPPLSGPGPICAPTPNKSSISSSSSPSCSSQMSAVPSLYDGSYPQMLVSQPANMNGAYALPASMSPSDTMSSWPTSTASISPQQHPAPTMQNMRAPPPSHINSTAFETVSNMAMYQNPLVTANSMPQELYSQDHTETTHAQAHPHPHSHPPHQPQISIAPASSAYSLLHGGAVSASCQPYAHMGMAQAIMPLQDQPMEDTTDPSYFSDWSLWDNQVQRVGLDTMPVTWTGFFPMNAGNGTMH